MNYDLWAHLRIIDHWDFIYAWAPQKEHLNQIQAVDWSFYCLVSCLSCPRFNFMSCPGVSSCGRLCVFVPDCFLFSQITCTVPAYLNRARLLSLHWVVALVCVTVVPDKLFVSVSSAIGSYFCPYVTGTAACMDNFSLHNQISNAITKNTR